MKNLFKCALLVDTDKEIIAGGQLIQLSGIYSGPVFVLCGIILSPL